MKGVSEHSDEKIMNSIVILLIAGVCLLLGYVCYGGFLAKKWGIDPQAKTPALKLEDDADYVPSSKFTVFSHQFSSIAGAGPVQGPILAAAFGWVPVLLWLLIGGIFFGAVQDFGALYASVKNDGKSIGLIIEKYIGKTGRRLFLLFCWLFTLLVIAAFTSMVAGTFNAVPSKDPAVLKKGFGAASAASISILFVFVAMFMAFAEKFIKSHVSKNTELIKFIVAAVVLVVTFAIGMKLPIYMIGKHWNLIILAYLFLASILPMWLLMQPRDYLTTILLVLMILGSVVGVLFVHPSMNLNAFNGFSIKGANGEISYLFPTLFVTIACGAVSGFHSLVSSGTSSKTISNEKDMKFVGYGAMSLETLLGVISLIVVGALSKGHAVPSGLTPFQIFSLGVGTFITKLGLPKIYVTVFMTMCLSSLALTSLDSVARIGRMSFQELFIGDTTDRSQMPFWQKLFTNQYFATIVTLIPGYLLCLGGYQNIWPLFGAANQMLAALVLIGIAVFLKATKRKGVMLYAPMFFMLCVTFTAIILNVQKNLTLLLSHKGTFLVNGLQLIVAVFLIVLGVMVTITCIKKLFGKTESVEEEDSVNNYVNSAN